jgi:hypothetical protein
MQPRRPDFYLELALLALRKVPPYVGTRTLQVYLADDFCQSATRRPGSRPVQGVAGMIPGAVSL